MSFELEHYTIDVALEEDYQTIINQFPTSVQDSIKTVDPTQKRAFRQLLWTIFGDPASQLNNQVELLALAGELTPASFMPKPPSPSDMAFSKAQAYSGQFLYGEFIRRIQANKVTADKGILRQAAELWLAMTDRLQLNFNRRERVADYLKDQKRRSGLLTALTCRLAALSQQISDSSVIELISTIGETLGVIENILTDVNLSEDSIIFRNRILSGNYPLPTIFAFETDSEWFDGFFAAREKPSSDQFETARKLSLQDGEKGALDLALELISQTKIDAESLPADQVQTRLLATLALLKNDADSYSI
ncbi:hypothetical protein [Secundilactobacillus folii]|uniref:Uncharacterized protein n=1 Tax=Secundilactobacillus folii TaxID=2678357 RepID=A0A7X3C1V7_9LACO|nr:hypothetical protein [Secundilactobacillus folii]MTV82155.1 hypothetical protein [Secundilactobacillus folii]